MATGNEKSPSDTTEDDFEAVTAPDSDDPPAGTGDDTEPPHPFGDMVRAFGDKVGDVAGTTRTVAVDRAKVVGRRLSVVAKSGATTAKRVPGKAWLAVGAGAAVGLGLLVRRRRRRRLRG